MFSGFDPRFFAFLKELKAHNTREWFADNKARYVAEVETPALQFITALAPALKTISPRFVARPTRVAGSLFRIHRDTRFSPDKTPFKTHIAMRFQHDAKGLERPPSFYLHLSPGECMGGGGLYHTDMPALRKIRQRIHDQPRDWQQVRESGFEIQGDQLKRVPPPYPAAHAFADDLRRKDYYAIDTYTLEEAMAPDFVDRYASECARIAPLVRFLCVALSVPF